MPANKAPVVDPPNDPSENVENVKQSCRNFSFKEAFTQMFFDNQKYFDFVDKCRKAGIEVPIIPGLKPLATKKQLNLLPHRFYVDLPEDLIVEVVKCKDNNAVREVGIEWCINQSKELQKAEIPVLHYYSMGRSSNIKEVAEAVF